MRAFTSIIEKKYPGAMRLAAGVERFIDNAIPTNFVRLPQG
jgi:hypothetical protein